jgi:hypothetical protein
MLEVGATPVTVKIHSDMTKYALLDRGFAARCAEGL